MQTFRKLPTTVPIRKKPRPSTTNIGQVDEHGAAPVVTEGRGRNCDDSSMRFQGVQRPRIACGHLFRALAVGRDHHVGQLGVQRRTRREDLRDLGERPGRGEGGPPGEAAPVGLEPSGQLVGIGRQPDDESELAEPRPVRLAEHRPAARRQDRPGTARTSARPGSAPPSRGTPARPTRRRSPDRPARRGPRSRGRRRRTAGPAARRGSRPTVDLPVPR